MNDLISKYAQILRDAKVGDFTYEGILAAFAHDIVKVESAKNDPEAGLFAPHGPGTNSGHGHVWPRPDGLKARCGGMSRCMVCANDARQIGIIGRDSS
jgi:hypothetical protein